MGLVLRQEHDHDRFGSHHLAAASMHARGDAYAQAGGGSQRSPDTAMCGGSAQFPASPVGYSHLPLTFTATLTVLRCFSDITLGASNSGQVHVFATRAAQWFPPYPGLWSVVLANDACRKQLARARELLNPVSHDPEQSQPVKRTTAQQPTQNAFRTEYW